MSKSLGNFLLMKDLVKEYSADAVRITLANAGDGLQDANIETQKSNEFEHNLLKLQ